MEKIMEKTESFNGRFLRIKEAENKKGLYGSTSGSPSF